MPFKFYQALLQTNHASAQPYLDILQLNSTDRGVIKVLSQIKAKEAEINKLISVQQVVLARKKREGAFGDLNVIPRVKRQKVEDETIAPDVATEVAVKRRRVERSLSMSPASLPTHSMDDDHLVQSWAKEQTDYISLASAIERYIKTTQEVAHFVQGVASSGFPDIARLFVDKAEIQEGFEQLKRLPKAQMGWMLAAERDAFIEDMTQLLAVEGELRLEAVKAVLHRRQGLAVSGYHVEPYREINLFCARLAWYVVNQEVDSAAKRRGFWDVLYKDFKGFGVSGDADDFYALLTEAEVEQLMPQYGEALVQMLPEGVVLRKAWFAHAGGMVDAERVSALMFKGAEWLSDCEVLNEAWGQNSACDNHTLLEFFASFEKLLQENSVYTAGSGATEQAIALKGATALDPYVFAFADIYQYFKTLGIKNSALLEELNKLNTGLTQWHQSCVALNKNHCKAIHTRLNSVDGAANLRVVEIREVVRQQRPKYRHKPQLSDRVIERLSADDAKYYLELDLQEAQFRVLLQKIDKEMRGPVSSLYWKEVFNFLLSLPVERARILYRLWRGNGFAERKGLVAACYALSLELKLMHGGEDVEGVLNQGWSEEDARIGDKERDFVASVLMHRDVANVERLPRVITILRLFGEMFHVQRVRHYVEWLKQYLRTVGAQLEALSAVIKADQYVWDEAFIQFYSDAASIEYRDVIKPQEVIDLFLSRLNCPRRRTSLIKPAISWGHTEVVAFLAESDAVLSMRQSDGATALHWAAESGYSAVVEYLLARGADIEARGNENITPLHCAVYHGHIAIVEHLLARGADIEARDSDDGTPLHWAASQGHIAIVEHLLARGADIEARDKSCRTPLYWVVYQGHIAIVEHLLARGADIEARDNNCRTPLHWAVYYGHIAIVEHLLARGADMHAVDVNGMIALEDAIKGHQPDVVDYLLKQTETKGMLSSAKEKYIPVLLNAVRIKNADVAERLIKLGVDINAQDKAGNTIWHVLADVQDCSEVLAQLELFIEKYAPAVTLENNHGVIALELAISNQNVGYALWLSDQMKKQRHKSGVTQFQWAIDKLILAKDWLKLRLMLNYMEGRGLLPQAACDLVRILFAVVREHPGGERDKFEQFLWKLIDINMSDQSGCTVLHYAAGCGNLQLVQSLVEQRDADFELKDGKGETAMDKAVAAGHLRVAEYLEKPFAPKNYRGGYFLSDMRLHLAVTVGNVGQVRRLALYGAAMEAKNGEGYTALQLAVMRGAQELVECLVQAGANIHTLSLEDENAVELAIKANKKDIWQFLLERVKPEDIHGAQKKKYEAILRNAVINKNVALIAQLIGCGVDVNAKDRSGGDTALHQAAREAHEGVVKCLLDLGADIHAEDVYGQMALELAIKNESFEVTQLLLERVKPEDICGAQKEKYEAILRTAAINRNVALAAQLIGRGVDVSAKDRSGGDTALHQAAREAHEGVVKCLLDLGADIHVEDVDGQIALELAIENESFEVTQLLLERVKPEDVCGAQKEKYEAILRAAAINGNAALVEQLIVGYGVDVNAKDRSGGDTALHQAAREAHEEVVKCLLDLGADIHAEDVYGQIALKVAIENESFEVTQLLLERVKPEDICGAKKAKYEAILHTVVIKEDVALVEQLVGCCGVDVNAQDGNGLAALHHIARKGQRGMADCLINLKANIELKTFSKEYTPLHIAVICGKEEMVAFLLKHGADIHAEDAQGQTALDWAMQTNHSAVLEFLLGKVSVEDVTGAYKKKYEKVFHGAAKKGDAQLVARLVKMGVNKNAIDAGGCTPLHWAAYNGCLEIVKCLLAAGCDRNAETDEGKTAVVLAQEGGHTAVADYLVQYNTVQRPQEIVEVESVASGAGVFFQASQASREGISAETKEVKMTAEL